MSMISHDSCHSLMPVISCLSLILVSYVDSLFNISSPGFMSKVPHVTCLWGKVLCRQLLMPIVFHTSGLMSVVSHVIFLMSIVPHYCSCQLSLMSMVSHVNCHSCQWSLMSTVPHINGLSCQLSLMSMVSCQLSLMSIVFHVTSLTCVFCHTSALLIHALLRL